MLSTGTTKAYHQVSESATDIVFNRDVDYIKCAIEEFDHARLLFKKIFYFLVFSVICFELFISAGVENSSAVKNKPSAISTDIYRNTFLVTETVYSHYEWRFIIGFQWSKSFNDFIRNANIQHSSKLRDRNPYVLMRNEPS